ncbi:MAG TPA: hypothetical protein VN777_14355 [Terriglobales bacterium]|nr:hypothetical protein [Terriglobales bacterium]
MAWKAWWQGGKYIPALLIHTILTPIFKLLREFLARVVQCAMTTMEEAGMVGRRSTIQGSNMATTIYPFTKS